MRIRQRIPISQLVDNSGVPVRPGWLLAGLCLAGAAKAIEPPFEVFYPPTAAPFGAGWSLAHFLASSWAVLLVIFMLAGGTLGDLYGRRKVLLVGLVVMLGANLMLLFSMDPLWHVVWRTLALASAGVVFPLTLAPIYVFYEGRQRVLAYAIYITFTALAGFLAGFQGNLFTRILDWRFSYLLPALLAVSAIVIVYRSLPESRTAVPRLMDVVVHTGWTVLVLAVIYTLFGIGLAREWLVVVLVIAAMAITVSLGMVIWWRRKTHASLVHNAVIHTRHVTVLILGGVIVQIALLGVYSLYYSYLRVGGNLNFTRTLLHLVPMFLGMLAAVLLVARIGARHQVRRVVGLGFLLVSIAVIFLAATARVPYWLQILPLVLFGASVIGTKTVWTNAFFQTMIDRYIGLNAGINSATLLVGGALGGLLTTNLLALFGESAFVRQAASALDLSRTGLETTYQHISTTISVGEQAGLQDLASLISSNLYAHYQRAYVSGYSLTLLVIAALCILAVLLILFGIIASLRFKPEDTPLDEDDDGAGIPAPSPGLSA